MDRGLARPLITGLVIGIVATLIVVAALGFFLFPLVLTHRRDFPLEAEIGTNRVLAAIPRADKIRKNLLPATPEALAAGAAQYAGNCAMCHGVDGRADTPIGKNMYPPAISLLDPRVTDMTDGEVAWIIRNGLSFVGMPAFDTLMSDEQIWQVVLHIHQLQGRPAPGAEAPVAQAGGQAPAAPAAGGGAAGKRLFSERGCAGCHGAEAQGGVGLKLAGTGRSFEQVLQVVRNGRGGMPAFPASVVPDAEVRQMYAWFESGE